MISLTFLGFPSLWESSKVNKSTLDISPTPLLNLKLLRPQGQIIDLKCEKSQLIGFFFSLANIELVRELVTSNMHDKFGQDT